MDHRLEQHLAEAVEVAVSERSRGAGAADERVAAVVAASDAIAARVDAGARLLALGDGPTTVDADHVAVEFLHPVIAGKRAVPALALAGPDDVALLGRPGDVLLVIGLSGDEGPLHAAVEAAAANDLLTVALVPGTGGLARSPHVAHLVAPAADDPHVVREQHVTSYHLLWELVHVFLGHDERLAAGRAGKGGGR